MFVKFCFLRDRRNFTSEYLVKPNDRYRVRQGAIVVVRQNPAVHSLRHLTAKVVSNDVRTNAKRNLCSRPISHRDIDLGIENGVNKRGQEMKFTLRPSSRESGRQH